MLINQGFEMRVTSMLGIISLPQIEHDVDALFSSDIQNDFRLRKKERIVIEQILVQRDFQNGVPR